MVRDKKYFDFFRLNFEVEKDFFIVEYGYEDFLKRKSPNRLRRLIHHNLQFVTRGKGFYTIDGIKHPLKQYDLFYRPPQELLLHQPDEKDPCKYFYVAMRGEKLSELISMTGLSKKNPVISLENPQRMMELFEIFSPQCPPSSLKLKACIYSIFDILCENKDTQNANGLSNGAIKLTESIIEFIKINFPQSDLAISDIAQQFHLEPLQLYRLFNATLGISAKQYLTDCRMKKAHERLSAGATVTVTAFSTGFSDVYYFSKIFKKYYGISPSQVKQGAALPAVNSQEL